MIFHIILFAGKNPHVSFLYYHHHPTLWTLNMERNYVCTIDKIHEWMGNVSNYRL